MIRIIMDGFMFFFIELNIIDSILLNSYFVFNLLYEWILNKKCCLNLEIFIRLSKSVGILFYLEYVWYELIMIWFFFF